MVTSRRRELLAAQPLLAPSEAVVTSRRRELAAQSLLAPSEAMETVLGRVYGPR